jgi:hypothetical protein
MAYLVNAIPVVGLSLALALRWGSSSIVLWRRRCIPVFWAWLSLDLAAFLQVMGLVSEQGIVYWPH